MAARKDEAVGVGGTGASNWSEPTKSSSMGLKNHVPDDVLDEAAGDPPKEDRWTRAKLDKIERERGAGGADVPLRAEEPYDPLLSFIRGDDDLDAPRPRGRPKGKKTDKASAAARKAPETTIKAASPEEIEAIEAEYAKAQEEAMSDVGLETMGPEEYAQKVDRPQRSYEYVDWKEARELERKAVAIGKAQNDYMRQLVRAAQSADPPQAVNAYEIRNKATAKFPGLTAAEKERLDQFYDQELRAEREGHGREALRGHRVKPLPVEMTLQGLTGDESTEDRIPPGGSRYAYGKTLPTGERVTNTKDFQSKYPDEFQALLASGVDPTKGMFVRLNDQAKRPKVPATLVRSDPAYDPKKASAYHLNMLLHRLSQQASSGGDVFWIGYRDWDHQEIEDGEDYRMRFDEEGRPTWEEVSSYDPEEIMSDPELSAQGPKSETDDWWNRQISPEGESVYVPEEERAYTKGEKPGESPEVPAGIEMLHDPDVGFEETEEYEDPETGEIRSWRRGVPAAVARDISRGRKMAPAPFDAPEEEWPEYREPVREQTEMRLREFFELDERKLSSYEHPRTHLAKKFEKDPDIDDPWALAQHIASKSGIDEGRGVPQPPSPGRKRHRPPQDDISVGVGPRPHVDPTEEESLAGGFDDPSSSQDPEHGGFERMGTASFGEAEPADPDHPGSEGEEGEIRSWRKGGVETVEVPEGVFQGDEEEGFGPMDEYDPDDPMTDEFGTKSPTDKESDEFMRKQGMHTPGSPDDPDVAGPVGDPGFGREEDEFARPHQTGEPGPEHRTKVDFPEYKPPKKRGRW